MEQALNIRIDDMKQEVSKAEKRQDEKWNAHYEYHKTEDSKRLQNKHFIWGVVFLSILQLGVAVFLHFMG